MDSIVIDTNVFSYRLKQDSRAPFYDKHLSGKRQLLCFMTVAELYQWTLVRKWGKRRRNELEEELHSCIVLPYDDDLAWEWARIMSIKGKPITTGDAWIAAAALRYGVPLVTHNRRHFEHVPGLTIISEA